MAKWIINRNGRASAIECDDVICDRLGRFKLWINNGKLFDSQGNQIGWAENGIFYDSDNRIIGFTSDHSGPLPTTPVIGAMPASMPGLGARPLYRPQFHVNNVRPGCGGWSNNLLEDYISRD